MSRGDHFQVIAKVVEVTPQKMVWIELQNGHRLLGHTSEKEREKVIKLLPGDEVSVVLSPYDLSQGRMLLGQK
jgi:translation initiation factor IF-1